MNHQYEDYQGLVYTVLKKLNMKKPYEDYIQDAYFIYDQCMKNYDSTKSNFSTYFTIQLTFYYMSLFRKQRDQSSRLSLLGHCSKDSFTPDPILDWISLHDIFYYCDLTEFEKSVVRLTLGGCTVGEISEAESVSETTVKRARKMIKEKTRKHLII
ncbi:sigma-70 family RNA polymerase sigma factor [Halobacillus amylolyticus]|uniref:RNA polymerase sigma factor SigS n=1 Tax=Halobacillus amylolyticus TaxID=2932259 RepID=A0ABY4H8Z6_9BACI|nr:sigma-70 family RNA polymerase sigma factor [Halobacillus amylolyticus]UOR11335.1 sigma-70 family RNA polymerase sigma factor [Halobacillus amylolyticus]